MTSKIFVRIILILAVTITSQSSKIGYAYDPNPDVILCGEFFYYLMVSSAFTSTSKYHAISRAASGLESYDLTNGILSNKVGSLSGNCNNENLASLWASNRAFSLYNLGRAPDRSI